MIDIHSHILPEVDDGPKSWETCVAMCRTAAEDGITHMVAAPHANDRYHYDRPYLQGLVEHLQKLIGDTRKSAWAAISTSRMTTCRTRSPIPSAM